jgi:hypothetical protein
VSIGTIILGVSTVAKLIKRLTSSPKDFGWNELKKVLSHFGYEEAKKGKTGGSRVKFIHPETKDVINLHKPHPKPVLKNYQVKQVVEKLQDLGLIK